MKNYKSIITTFDSFDILRRVMKRLFGDDLHKKIPFVIKNLDQNVGAKLRDVLFSKQIEIEGMKVVRKIYKIKRLSDTRTPPSN